MAPVGNNGPYIPRLDLEQPRKSSLAIRNVTPTPLSDITNQQTTRTGRSGSGSGTGSSNVGGASSVGARTEPGDVRLNPNARKGDPTRDSITIESQTVRRGIETARAAGTLNTNISRTGAFPEHPTSELVLGGNLWSHTRQTAAAAAQFKVTSSGCYELTAALAEQAPVAQAAKRGSTGTSTARRPMSLRSAN